MDSRVLQLSSYAFRNLLQQGLFRTDLVSSYNISSEKSEANKQLGSVESVVNRHLEMMLDELKQHIHYKHYDEAEELLDLFPGIVVHMLDCPPLAKVTDAIKAALAEELVTVEQIEKMSKQQILAWFLSDRSLSWFGNKGCQEAKSRYHVLKIFNPDELINIQDSWKLMLLLTFCPKTARQALNLGALSIADINTMSNPIMLELLSDEKIKDIGVVDSKIKLKVLMQVRSDGLLEVILDNIDNAALMLASGLMSLEEMNNNYQNVLPLLLSDQGVIVRKKKLLTAAHVARLIAIPEGRVINLYDLLNNEKVFNALQNGMPIDDYIVLLEKYQRSYDAILDRTPEPEIDSFVAQFLITENAVMEDAPVELKRQHEDSTSSAGPAKPGSENDEEQDESSSSRPSKRARK